MRIIITGASNGLGYELSKLVKGKVHCMDLKEPENKVSGVVYHKIDITSEKSIKILEKIGEVDLIINNAGIMSRDFMKDISLKDYDLLFDLNVKASWIITRYAKLKKGGLVVFINSRHGTLLQKNPSSYSLSKNMLKLLANSFKLEGFNVKQAFLGPFEGGASKVGFSKEEYEERQKDNTLKIAKLVLKLINSRYSKLMYKNITRKYSFIK